VAQLADPARGLSALLNKSLHMHRLKDELPASGANRGEFSSTSQNRDHLSAEPESSSRVNRGHQVAVAEFHGCTHL